jgi:hypothetical protein
VKDIPIDEIQVPPKKPELLPKSQVPQFTTKPLSPQSSDGKQPDP